MTLLKRAGGCCLGTLLDAWVFDRLRFVLLCTAAVLLGFCPIILKLNRC